MTISVLASRPSFWEHLMVFITYSPRIIIISEFTPIEQISIILVISLSATDISAKKTKESKQPGKAIAIAAITSPLEPAQFTPIPDANSTGRAPGVILAITTCFENSPSEIIFFSSTASLCIIGINALPPPKPINPIFSINVNSCFSIFPPTQSTIYFYSACSL